MDKCPICGYSEKVNNIAQSHIMNNYKHETTGTISVISSDSPVIENENGKWILVPREGAPTNTMPVVEQSLGAVPKLIAQPVAQKYNPEAQKAAAIKQNIPAQP